MGDAKRYIGSFPTGVSKRNPDGGRMPYCPFCGAPAILTVYDDGWAAVCCSNGRCGVDPHTGAHLPSVDCALGDWSSRADPEAPGKGRDIADSTAAALLSGCGGRMCGAGEEELGKLVVEAVESSWPGRLESGAYRMGSVAKALAMMLRHVDPSGGES